MALRCDNEFIKFKGSSFKSVEVKILKKNVNFALIYIKILEI